MEQSRVHPVLAMPQSVGRGTPLDSGLHPDMHPVCSQPSQQLVRNPTSVFNVGRKRKRTSNACKGCQRAKARCDGCEPCERCIRLEEQCDYTDIDRRDANVVRAMQDDVVQKMFDRLDTILAGQVSTSIVEPSYVLVPGVAHRSMMKHHLSVIPTNMAAFAHIDYYKKAFVPGRCFTKNHVFQALLCYEQPKITTTLLALTSLYLNQLRACSVETSHRHTVDQQMMDRYLRIWKGQDKLNRRLLLYNVLLANQYFIIRPRLKQFWSKMAIPSLRSRLAQQTLHDNQDCALQTKINSHWIFSDVAYRLSPEQPDVLQIGNDDVQQTIDPLVGLSPELLNFYALVTRKTSQQSSSPNSRDPGVLQCLQQINQNMPNDVDLVSPKDRFLKSTAQAYLHAAQIYTLCRYYRLPVSNAEVASHRAALWEILRSLPSSGEYFNAVWPLLPAFILCVTCYDVEERFVLGGELVQELYQSGAYSNIPPVLDAIKRIWFREKLATMENGGWWEKMVALIGDERISLT